MFDRKAHAKTLVDTYGVHAAEGGNKSPCTYAIAQALTVQHVTRYLHTYSDLLRAIRTTYAATSCKTDLGMRKGKHTSVGNLRKRIADIGGKCLYLVMVEGHVLLLGPTGDTWVDTDPRKCDRRRVYKVHRITSK